MNLVNNFLDAAAGAADLPAPTAMEQLVSTLSPIFMIAVVAAVFYFFIYRPQKKQEKQVAEMRSSLGVNDEISTTAGILGKVIQIKDDYIIIETGNDKTKLKLAKWAIRAIEKSANDDDDDE